MEKHKNYRIKDIAEMSGVSTGTVDRILHNRGKVSEEARKKVDKILKEIDYQPNLIARSLALKKTYRILVLIPSFVDGEYWSILNKGIDKAEHELFSYNVEVERIYFDQYDQSSFDKLIPEIEKKDCEGVVIATLFKDSVLKLTATLDLREIPYIFIDAYIENTNCIAYYGTHSYDSGYIAGKLMYEQIQSEESLAIFRLMRKEDISSTQVSQRENGFRNYLTENNHQGKIFLVNIHANNPEENIQILDTFLTSHPNIKKGIIFNSRAYILGNYFMKKDYDDFKLIGYDVIDQNVFYLENGLITHLIAQRPEVQGINCIKALFNHLLLKEKINLINYMPIDILIKENIQYYNNYI